MTNLEKFRMKRNRRLQSRGLPIFRLDAGSIHNNNRNQGGEEAPETEGGGGGKEGGHGNTRLPYGIAKGLGIDTTGLKPREVWDLLKGKGISPDAVFKELEETGEVDVSKITGETTPDVSEPKEPEIPEKKTFSTSTGKTVNKLEIGETGAWRSSEKYCISGEGDDGARHKVLKAGSKEDLLYALKEEGVTSVRVGGEDIDPHKAGLPEALFKVSDDYMGDGVRRYISEIKQADDGSIEVIGVDGKVHQRYSSYMDVKDARKGIMTMSDGKVDIAELESIPEKIRDYLKAYDAFTDTFTDESRGREYKKLSIEPCGDKVKLSGYTTDGSDTKMFVRNFPTKGDAFIWLKEHGVARIDDPESKEILNVADIEIPKVVGHDSYGATHYSKITISKSKDEYVVKATDLSGKTKKVHSAPTYSTCVKYATDKMGCAESDLTVSGKTKKAAIADDAWKTSNKKEYFELSDGTKVGALKGEFDGYSWELKGKSEGRWGSHSERFHSKEALLFALKERGVERFRYTDIDGTEKTAHPMKETFADDAIPCGGELYTNVRVDYGGTSYAGRPLYKLVGVRPDGTEHNIRTSQSSIEYAKLSVDEKYRSLIKITDAAQNADEVVRKEREEKERIERERREAEERARAEKAARKAAFEAREREAVLKEPEKYHMYGGNALSDVKVVVSGKHTTMMGTDIDGKVHTIDSDYGDYSSHYVSELTKAGFKDVPVEKAKRFKFTDRWGDEVDVSGIKISESYGEFVATSSEGHTITKGSSVEEVEEKLKDYGMDSYYKPDDSVVGTPSKVWGTPTDGMHDAVIKKTKDGKYGITAHSDKAGGSALVFTGSSEAECKKWLEDNNVDPYDVPVVTPNPNDDVVRVHTEVSLSNFDSHRVKRSMKSFISKMTETEKTDCANMLTDIFKNQSYRMTRSTDSFVKIVMGGFLSQLETGTGGYGAALSRSGRKDASEKYFGEPKSTKDHDYEKYGYIDSDDDDETSPPCYGTNSNVLYKFRKETIKNRTTYSMGDSLNTRYNEGSCAGYAGDAPTIEGIASSNYSRMKGWLKDYKKYKNGELTAKQLFDNVKNTLECNYIETQYHGELTIADVESALFQEKDLKKTFGGMSVEERKQVVGKLKQNNVKLLYRKAGGKYTNDVYEWLKNQFPDETYD